MPEGVQGAKIWAALQQLAQVVGVDAVNVLVRVDGLDDPVAVDSTGKGELHQYAVNAGVFVEPVDGGKDFVLGGGGREISGVAEQPGLLAGAALISDVDGGRGVVADKHDGQTGGYAVLLLHLDDAIGNLGAYLRRQVCAGQNLGRHRRASQLTSSGIVSLPRLYERDEICFPVPFRPNLSCFAFLILGWKFCFPAVSGHFLPLPEPGFCRYGD